MNTSNSELNNPELTDLELAAFDVCTLADALTTGLDLVDVFGRDGDFCAAWLGDDNGATIDFVVFTEESGLDVEHLVRYGAIGAGVLGARRVVVWCSDDDLTDGPRLADAYFRHRDTIEEAGATLVDEIVLGGEELRSMAVTTFTDEPGWDDVSERVEVGES